VGRWLAGLLGLLLAVALCGCASGAARSGSHKHLRPPATFEELAWVGRFDQWYMYERFPAGCADRLSSEAGGGAPSFRLATAYRRSLVACTHFQHWEDDRADKNDTLADAEFRKGLGIVKAVSKSLNPFRPGMQMLPRRRGPSSASRTEVRYSHVASAVSSHDGVRVRCWSLPDWVKVLRRFQAYTGGPAPDLIGFVIKPRDVSLSPGACKALDEFAYEHARPRDRSGLDDLAEGLNALAHESQHIAHPRSSEAVVQCYGVQSIRAVAELLGGDERYGLALAHAYFRDIYPELPAAYRTRVCRNNGPLDAHPREDHWP
jgi:hypothetical protein